MAARGKKEAMRCDKAQCAAASAPAGAGCRAARGAKKYTHPIIRLAVCREKRDDAEDAAPKLTPGYPHVDMHAQPPKSK
jgi:hypothetical protein